MVLVATQAKPFMYSGKGTPRRAAILQEYEQEIEDLYKTVETSQLDVDPPSDWSPDSALSFVRKAVQNVLKQSIDDGEDIFESGCDR